jgi:TonB family protein
MERYFLIATVSSIVFYAIYYFFLRKESFHKFNRFYLLGALIISLLIPFVRFTIPAPILAAEQASTLSELIIYIQLPEFTVSAQTASGWSLAKIFWSIYLIGVAFFALLFIVKLIKISSLIIQSKKIRKDNYIFVEYDENNAPFSFFNYIFMNADAYNQEDKENIILHEKIHVKQHHSWDLIFVELLGIVLWFNPVILLYKRSLQIIHEYLADHRVLQHGIEQGAYLDLLLRQLMLPNMSVGAQNFVRVPGHHFNYLLTKNRFKMLKNHYYSKWAFAKAIFVLPLIAFLLMLNCKPKTEELEVIEYQISLENMKSESDEECTYEIDIIQADGSVKKIDVRKLEKVPEGSDVFFLDKDGNVDTSFTFHWAENKTEVKEAPLRFVEVMPEPVGGMDAMYKFLQENLTYPKEARDKGISGTVFIEFVVEKDGSISNVKVLKSVDPDLDAESVRVVKLMPKWNPGKQMGKPVRCYFNIPIRFTIN